MRFLISHLIIISLHAYNNYKHEEIPIRNSDLSHLCSVSRIKLNVPSSSETDYPSARDCDPDLSCIAIRSLTFIHDRILSLA
jgi:hypothetical protein